MRSSYSIGIFAPALLAALVGTVATLPARAAGPAVEQSTAVRYDDLDLDKAAGVEALYARLRAAAEKVCDARFLPGTLVVAPAWRTCMAGALDQAVAAVDQPALTSYHAANTSRADARNADRLAARN